MDRTGHELRAWLHGVRRAWRRSAIWLAVARAAAGLAVLGWAGWIVWRTLNLTGLPLVLLTAALVAGGAVFAVRMLLPLRRSPSDQQIARYVEERVPELDDLLVTATQKLDAPTRGPLDGLMLGSATRRVSVIERARIVDPEGVRKRTFAAIAALVVLAAALVVWRVPGWSAFQTTRMWVAPPVLTLLVTPGDARAQAGIPLKITARLEGLLEGVTPEPATLHVKVGGRERTVKMTQQGTQYHAEVPVERDFQYRIVTDRLASRDFTVTALHPAQVERIDVEYEYPTFTGLKPRVDENSGDIFGPAGTKVKVRVTSSKPVTSGALAIRGGTPVPLAGAGGSASSSGGASQLETSFTIVKDAAYRVTLKDIDGLTNVDATEYFIRLLNDRPPDVRVLRPGGDRQVTRLEEIVIEARADDDYGVSNLDLVYAVRGGAERVIPLYKPTPSAAATGVDQTNVSGAHTLYVEELDVQPGDFITYYARARDVPRGKRSSEARSDIFFLEVRPFAEEFVAAQSQAFMASGGGGAGDLLEAQKEIIVATWKVQRRAEAGKSEQDIKSIAKAQTELKGRAEQMAAMSAMVNPGRRRAARGSDPAAPQSSTGDPISLAAGEMGKAAQALDGLKPDEAIPHEMTAYNHLLRAQADTRRTQVARQRGGGGGGGRTGTQDLSALFDRELMRQQETNYETRSTVEQRDENSQESALDKIRELARRQDDLARQQRELARQRGSLEQEEMKRRLERLTKEQDQLRRQAEQLAQQLGQQNGQQSASQSGQQGQQASAGSQSGSQQGQSSGQPQAGQPSGQQQGGQQAGNNDALRQAANAMGDAARDLARADLNQAQANSERTLEQLRDIERRLRGTQPDERRRAIGELQVEAQQMADAQQRLSAESRRLQQQGSPASGDALRRMATEQDKLAERLGSLRRGLAELSAGAAGASQDASSLRAAQDEIARQKLDDRMRQGASALRDAGNKNGGTSASQMGSLANQQDALARGMAQVAQKMGSSVAGNAEARKLSDQLAQVRDQKAKLDEISGRMQELARQAQQGQNGPQTPGARGSQPGPLANANGSRGQQPGQTQSGQQGSQGQQAGNQNGGGQGQGGGRDGNTPGGELSRLQAEYDRTLQQTRELLDQLRRDQSGEGGQNGPGGRGTPMHHEFSRSAPGTEAFKQDYARWDVLRKDVASALEQAESSLAQKLSEREARDRLNAGGDDRAPAEYAESVSRYYRSLAAKRQQPK